MAFDSQPVPNKSGRSITQSEMQISPLNLGGIPLYANLPPASAHFTDFVYTSDQGLCYSNGTTWLKITTT